MTEIRTGGLDASGGAVTWEWQLTDLEPETEITYRIILEDPETGAALPSSSASLAFRTAPEPGSHAPFRFAVMSDSRAGPADPLANVEGVNWRALRRLMAEANRQDVRLILFPGDLVNGYTASPLDFNRQLRSWRHAVEPVAALTPIFEGMGNHEAVGPAQAANARYLQRAHTDDNSPERLFSAQFVNPANGPASPERIGDLEGPPYGETVYSFDWGNAHFVSVNSNHWWMSPYGDSDFTQGNREGSVMDGQLAWLDADLAAARERGQRHLFVYTHEPMFPNGGHLGDAMYWGGEIPEVLAMRDRLVEILTRHGVLAVFHGDEHNYSRTLIDSSVTEAASQPLWQITTGGAGAPYYSQEQTPWSDKVEAFSVQIHLVLVQVEGDEVTVLAVSETGQRLDGAVLTRAPAEL
jgi:3',5'-cyclic AMP phosphodiesterase CpdA